MRAALTLPPVSASKDPADYPLFKGKISRWIWRIYTQRLTPAGRWFAIASAVFVAYGGASLELKAYMLAAYAAAIWWIALSAMILYRPRVKLAVTMPPRVSAGETAQVDLEIEQLARGRGADLAVIPHRLPGAIDCFPGEGAVIPDLKPRQRARVRVGLRCNRRGSYTLVGFRVESSFPFGLLRARRIISAPRSLLVYPRFTPLSYLRLPTGRRYQPGGVALASELGESFEYLGNREYRDGDNVRDIDWRATARVQRPIVREWVEEYMLRVAVILDTHVPPRANEERRDAFEHAVSLAAAVSDYMARQDYLVDLFAAGPNLYHLTAGRSLAYLDQILDILACVEANPAEPFDVIEPQIAELLSRISTVICVLLDWNDARRAFIERLRQYGVAVKVIIVSDAAHAPDEIDPSSTTIIDHHDYERGITEL